MHRAPTPILSTHPIPVGATRFLARRFIYIQSSAAGPPISRRGAPAYAPVPSLFAVLIGGGHTGPPLQKSFDW